MTSLNDRHLRWRRGVVVASLVSINEVNLRWARLVLGWVTVSGFDSRRRHFILVCNQPPRSTQPSTQPISSSWHHIFVSEQHRHWSIYDELTYFFVICNVKALTYIDDWTTRKELTQLRELFDTTPLRPPAAMQLIICSSKPDETALNRIGSHCKTFTVSDTVIGCFAIHLFRMSLSSILCPLLCTSIDPCDRSVYVDGACRTYRRCLFKV